MNAEDYKDMKNLLRFVIEEAAISTAERNVNDGQANIVDSLFAIARGLEHVAEAIKAGQVDRTVAVEALTVSAPFVTTADLDRVGKLLRDGLDEVAYAVRSR